MAAFPDKQTLTAALWDKIVIPDLYTTPSIPQSQWKAIETEAKTRFIDGLLENARPEHVEAIMHQAVEGKYMAFMSVHDGVGHIYDSIKKHQGQKWLPYDPADASAGLASRGMTINALGIVDDKGKLRPQPAGSLKLDPHFDRRVVHETGHILDIDHPRGAFAYSEGSTRYIEARTQDRFHAQLMDHVHDVMDRTGNTSLSAADKALLEGRYQRLKRWYEERMVAPTDGKTFVAGERMPATMDEYFMRLPERNGAISEHMGKLLAENPELAHDHANAYVKLLRKQYEEFGGIKSDKQFIRQFGKDVKEHVIERITELDYYPRSQRVTESIAKVIDAAGVNLNHAGQALPGGRNPLAALHLPNIEEHIEATVYEDLHRRNLQKRQQLGTQYEELWAKAGLDPQAQQALQLEANLAREGGGAIGSQEQRALQQERRRAARAQRKQAAAEKAAANKPIEVLEPEVLPVADPLPQPHDAAPVLEPDVVPVAKPVKEVPPAVEPPPVMRAVERDGSMAAVQAEERAVEIAEKGSKLGRYALIGGAVVAAALLAANWMKKKPVAPASKKDENPQPPKNPYDFGEYAAAADKSWAAQVQAERMQPQLIER